MKILLTGASGYIGKRLLPELVLKGHIVYCLVRDRLRFTPPEALKARIHVVEGDLLDRASLNRIPADIEAAYYLVHSMSGSADYATLEKRSAANFVSALGDTRAKQVIYLGGVINGCALSPHLRSRKNVEIELQKGKFALTSLRAGVIIGSGSASFEIIRDLVEKLPVMVAPKWLNTRCQPIAVSNVLDYLVGVLGRSSFCDQVYDIGGPDVMTYRQILLGYARARGLRRFIFTVPVMTPKISSYWLYFITSTSYKLAVALVDSMKVDVVCQPNDLHQELGVDRLSYEIALERAFEKIEGNQVVSSWKDSLISGEFDRKLSEFLEVPNHGCFKDRRQKRIRDAAVTKDRIWRIGGDVGWYHANFLWRIRGFLDKCFGGVGLRRGRSHPSKIRSGDAIDFWRVLYADKESGRLLLFAEMKLPGEAWLEFKLSGEQLLQTATYRPQGVLGRLYWYSVLPFHGVVFKGMLDKLAKG